MIVIAGSALDRRMRRNGDCGTDGRLETGFSYCQLLLTALHSFSWKSYYWQLLIDNPPQFQLEMLLLAAWGSPGSLLERSVEVRVQGQWGGNSRAGGIGFGRVGGWW